ncbi:MAG: ribbon-helix-helix domain-containing protein [Phycisphaerae bacterium]
MKTAISIPDPLFAAAERLAKRLGISRSELFQCAVKAFLREHKDEGLTQALDKVYGADRREAKLDHVLERLQLASLPKEEW